MESRTGVAGQLDPSGAVVTSPVRRVVTYRAVPGEQGRFLSVAGGVKDVLGAPSSRILADDDYWSRHLHPADQAAALEQEEIGFRNGELVSEYRIVREDGRLVWVLDEANVVEDPVEGPVFDGVFVDVTSLRRSELKVAAHGLLVEQVSAGAPLADCLEPLVRAAGEMCMAHHCRVSVGADTTVAHELAASGPILTEHEAVDHVRDCGLDGPGEASILAAPSPDVEDTLAWLADTTVQAQRMLADRSRSLRAAALAAATLESTVDGLLVVDQAGHVVGYNQKFASMWRVPPGLLEAGDDEAVMGSVLGQLVDPAAFQAGVTALYEDTVATSFDEILFTDGRIFERYSQPQRLEGRVVGRVWSFRDVTAGRQLQRELATAADTLQRQQRVLELLGTVAAAANSAVSVEAAVAQTLDALCEFGEWDVAHAWLAPRSAATASTHMWTASAGPDDDSFRSQTESTELTDLPVVGLAMERGVPVWSDTREWSSAAWLRTAESVGLRTAVALPIRVRDNAVGVLEMFSRSVIEEDAAVTEVMSQVGVHLGRSVERHYAEDDLASQSTALQELTDQMGTVLDSVDEGIFGVGGDGVITFVNRAGEDLVRLPRTSILGRTDVEVLSLACVPATRSAQAVATPAGAVPPEVRPGLPERGTHVRADGSSFDAEWVVSPMRTRSGAVVIVRDIGQVQVVERMKDQFTAMVSHELRTPLTSLRGSLGLLSGGAAGELPPAAARMVALATTSADRLVRLVSDILDAERLRTGRLVLHPAEVPVDDLVSAASLDAAAALKRAAVALEYTPTPLTVRVDSDRIVQVLANLLVNASKFSSQGASIDLDVRADDHWATFEVRDHGSGIPAEMVEKIFEPFVQVDATDTRSHQGSGLGLAISRDIVRLHGGDMHAGGTEGGGARFTFTVPLA
ncbi:ATP-binding protein [Pedococcus soli]